MQLSIVIPAFNESARLGRTLDAYLPHFTALYGEDFEVIVVVNGSVDNTESVAEAYAKKHPQIRVIVDPRRIGKGGAVIKGFAAARGDLIGFADADCATSPQAFHALIQNIGSAGAIIASRWLPESVLIPPQPLSRRISSRVFNLCVTALFGFRISDTQCGAKLMTREALQAVLPHMGVTRWAFDVDLLFQLHRAGFTILEAPTVWQDISGSTLNIPQAALEMFVAIIRLRLIYSPFKWVVKVYDKTVGRFIHISQ